MYYVYVASSLKLNYLYVGITNYVVRRMSEYNNGYNPTTEPYRPFKLMLSESFSTRPQARNREKYLKSGCGKEYLKSLK